MFSSAHPHSLISSQRGVVLLMFLAPLAIPACGSSGRVNTSPVTILATVPEENATGIAVGTTVTATFSEDIDATTLTSDTFTLATGGTAVASTVTYSSEDKEAILTPTAFLLENTEYTVTLGPQVKDLNGFSLETTTWDFTTVGSATDSQTNNTAGSGGTNTSGGSGGTTSTGGGTVVVGGLGTSGNNLPGALKITDGSGTLPAGEIIFYSDGALKRVAASATTTSSSTPAVSTLATGIEPPWDMELTSQFAYLSISGSTGQSGSIVKVALDGSGKTVLASGLFGPSGVDCDDNFCYVGLSTSSNAANILKISRTNDQVANVFSTGQVQWVQDVVVETNGSGTTLYFAEAYTDGLGNIPICCGKFRKYGPSATTGANALTDILTDLNQPGEVLLDSSYTYVALGTPISGTADGAVDRLDRATTQAITTTTALANQLKGRPRIVLDSSTIYLAEYGTAAGQCDGAIKKIPIIGTAPQTLVTACNPVALTVDGTNVYWTEPGALKKTTK